MRRACFACLVIAFPAVVPGQDEGGSNVNTQRGGVRVESVSISSGYYSSGSPAGLEVPAQSSFAGPTALMSGSVTIGGSSTGEKSSLTWSYSPAYFSTIYSTNNSPTHGSLNHRAAVNWRRQMASKWTVNASVNGFLASIEQLYFAPGLLSGVTALPTSFDNLAAAMLAGKFTDPQLAALLTGSSLQSSPEQAFPYGSRLMSGSASLGLAWAPSGRTTVAVTLMGTRTQSVNNGGTTGENPVNSGPTLPQITTAGAAVSWSYALSPRTQIGVQTTSNRTFSSIQQGYATSANFTVGRTMSRRWFLQARGGAGILTYSLQQYANPSTAQYLFGGNIGFKTASHTFIAGYDRSLGDAYGLGSGATASATGAWHWARPGGGWFASAGGGYQRLENGTFQNTKSWRAQAAVGRSLGRQLSMNWQFVYFQLPGDVTRAGRDNSETGVLVSLSWRPPQHH